MKRILRISTLLVVLFVAQGWSRPDTYFESDYVDDADAADDYTVPEDESDNSRNDVGTPEITSQPVSRRVRPGENITLPCTVVNASSVNVIWKKDSNVLYLDDTSFTAETNRIIKLRNNSLMIINASANDSSDNYSCELSTETVTKIVHRVLVEPDVILTPSEDVIVSYGEDVELGCKSNVLPDGDVTWNYMGQRLSIGKKIARQGFSLKIRNATRHHAGLYQCLVDNHKRKPLHDAVRLVVNYKPEIEVGSESVHTGMGSESELFCIVHAHPSANVMWYRNNKLVTPNGKISIRNISSTQHILVVKHTKSHDFGIYTCVASNFMGNATRNISLTGVPTKANFTGGEFGDHDTTFILKWSLQSYSPITEYKLLYRRKGDNSWVEMTPRVTDGKGAGEITYTVEHPLKGLEPGLYETTLIAKNNYGWSPTSEPFTFSGEYEAADSSQHPTGSAVTSRPLLALTTLLLVVTSYISTNL